MTNLPDRSSDCLCCVVFGAAVRAGGVPSGTLKRRVDGSFSIGGVNARYFVTGGIGDYPPAEAELMSVMLERHGVPRLQIIVDANATDTLSSAENCARLISLDGSCARVVVCSSRYHMPRCRMLLRRLGIPAVTGSMPKDRPHVRRIKLIYFYLREVIAYPYDLILVLFSRRFSRYRPERERT